MVCRVLPQHCQVTTYPREGTETFFNYFKKSIYFVTTYPREGTETDRSSFLLLQSQVTTYPREGTETFCPRFPLIGGCVTTYPREGTTAFSFATTVHLSVTTYPRKGTKKALSEKTERAFSCLYNSKKIRPPYRFGTAASNCSADYFCGLHAHSGSTRPWEQFS